MKGVSILVICAFGLVVVSSQDWHKNWSNLLSSIANQTSNNGQNGGTCDHKDRKNHAIDLLNEWITHKHYDAVDKLYHDIYHKDLSAARRKRQWHHYTSNFDEAFLHSNRDPDYRHVEGYIMINMNQACRVELRKWIENLAHHHNPHAATTAKPTHAHVRTTTKPTRAHERTTAKPTHAREQTSSTRATTISVNVISLLHDWERHNHFSDVQRLYLDVALGFHALTETNGDDTTAHDKSVRHSLLILSSNCKKMVYTWIEDDARKHTVAT
ncbi:uncharacterized protein LOC134689915 [Mytilus trossulus]|uniref:uncharacterized protein LOC134689915 n=1 Tax=Mytilus trossulus TaxID=6551 RepID=UPI0030045C53